MTTRSGGAIGSLSPFKWLTLSPDVDLSDYRVKARCWVRTSPATTSPWSTSLDIDVHMPFGTQCRSAAILRPHGHLAGTEAAGRHRRRGQAKPAEPGTVNHPAGRQPARPRTYKSVSEGRGSIPVRPGTRKPRVITLAVSYNLNSFRFDSKMREGEGTEMQGGPGH